MGLDAAAIAWIAAAVSVGSAYYASTLDTDQNSGVQLTKHGSQNPRNKVYGEAIVSSTFVYTNVWNKRKDTRLDVFSVGGVGPVHMRNIWIDEVPMFASDKTTSYIPYQKWKNNNFRAFSEDDMTESYRKAGHFFMDWGSGTENQQASTMAMRFSDGEWTAAHKGALVPYVAILADYSTDPEYVIFGDRYDLKARVEAYPLYDPRTGKIDGPSNNPALALRDFLTNSYYGLGIAPEYINDDAVSHAADMCEIYGLQINSEIDASKPYSETLEDILKCFSGALIIHEGKLEILFEDQEDFDLYDFNEDNIIKGSFKLSPASTGSYYNAVSVTFKSGINKEKEDDFIIPTDVVNDPRILADGYLETKSFDMPFTIDAVSGAVEGAVKWVANREYARANYQSTCSFDVDLLTYPLLKIWSVISVSHDIYGLDKARYRVQSIKSSIDDERLNIATINLVEYNDAIYEGDLNGVTGSPLPVIEHDPVPTPINVALSLESYTNEGYGVLSWERTAFTNSITFDIEYKLSDVPDWTRRASQHRGDSFDFHGLKAKKYDFRIRTHDTIRGYSDWAYLNEQDITTPYTLPSVTGLSVSASSPDFIIKWDDMSGVQINNGNSDNPDAAGSNGVVADVFSHYEIVVRRGTTIRETLRTTELEYVYKFDQNLASSDGLTRSINVLVSLVDKVGNKSSSVSVSAVNEQIESPTNTRVINVSGTSLVEWDPVTARDFAGTLVYVSNTSGFTPSDANLHKVISNEARYVYTFGEDTSDVYCRIAHFDLFGRDGIEFSPEVNLKHIPVTVEIDYDALNEATGLAESARDIAQQAASDSEQAQATAQAAAATAEGILDDAQAAAAAAQATITQAETQANTLLKGANAAKDEATAQAGLANEARGLANEARGAAESAYESANEAQQTAASLLKATESAKDEAVTQAGLAEEARGAAVTAYETAEGHAAAALVSKNEAAESAGEAETAASSAVQAATDADGSASAALAAKTEAEDAASSAGTSAQAAVNAKTDAAGSASTALTAKSEAETYAEDAEGSALTAKTNAQAAVTAKTDAAGSASTALTAKSEAVDAAEAAVTAKSDAKGAASAALLAKSGAEDAAEAAVTAQTDAEGAASAALTAKGAAEDAAGNASSSADAAVIAKAAAKGSAETALVAQSAAEDAASDASLSATAAVNAKTAADGSASAALTAKSDAEDAASAASTSAAAAVNAATAADGSASAALTAKSDAEEAASKSASSSAAAVQAKTDAAGSAAAALAAKSEAVTAADDASDSAGAASLSATAAATSAANADGSASSALTAKSEAETFAGEAEDSATLASTKAQAAATAATKADGSASAALTAKTAVVTAKNQAVTAKNQAVTAKGDAEDAAEAASVSAEAAVTAQTDAEGSASAALTAKSSAVTAKNAAVVAKGGAEAAAEAAEGSASAASVSAESAVKAAADADGSASAALVAKSGAVSAKNAAVVAQGDAEDAASAASVSAQAAATAATDAEGNATAAISAKSAAISAKNSAVNAKGDAEDAAEAAEGSASAASVSAQAAATAATNADGSASAALTAKSQAVAAKDDAEDAAAAASSSASAAVSAKTSASGSASAALTAKSDAEDSAEAAAGSASSASKSATAAATSATDADGSAQAALTAKSDAEDFAGQASTSATAAATAEANADGSAQAALTAKSEAEGFAGQASTSASAAVNAKTDAVGSASVALTAKSDAVTARDAAKGYRDTASSHATTAATKASVAIKAATDAGEKAELVTQVSYATGTGFIVNTSEGLNSNSYTGEIPTNDGPSFRASTYEDTDDGIILKRGRWYYSKALMRVDTSKRYEVKARFKVLTNSTTTSKNKFYVGVVTLDENFQPITGGAGTHRYCTLSGSGLNASDTYREYSGFIEGIGDNHSNFRAGTKYIRLVLITHYSSGDGTTLLDNMSIHDVDLISAVEERVTATEDEAFYSLKVQSNGKVAGWGATASPAGTTITFQADQIGFTNSTGSDVFPFTIKDDIVYMDKARLQTLEANTIINVDSVYGTDKRAQLGNTLVEGEFILQQPEQIEWKDLNSDFRDRLVLRAKDAISTGGTYTGSGPVDNGGLVYAAKAGSTTSPVVNSGGKFTEVRVKITGGQGFGNPSGSPLGVPKANFTIYRKNLRTGATETIGSESVAGTARYEDTTPRTYYSSINTNTVMNPSLPTNGDTYEYWIRFTSKTGSWGPTGGNATVTVIEELSSSDSLVVNTEWDLVKNKPSTATRWPNWSEIGSKPSYLGLDTSGSSDYPRMIAQNNPAVSSVWVRVPATDGGLLPYSNGNSNLGTSSWKFKEVHSVNFYENGTALSSKYLGKGAKAADADLLDGLHASSFARTAGTYSGLRAQATTKADVGLGNVPNWSSSTFDGRYLGKTAKAVDADKLDGLHASAFSRSDHVHNSLSPYPSYTGVFSNANNTPRSFYAAGLSSVFVRSSDGWPISYGTLFNVPSYTSGQDGGAFQLISPYDLGYTQNGNPMFRTGDYNNQGWSGWKTIMDKAWADNLYLGKTAKAVDSDKLDGLHASSFVKTSKLEALSSTSKVSADSWDRTGIHYSDVALFGSPDGAIYANAYSSTWQHQIYGDYRTGNIAVRGKNNGTWQAWRTVWTSGNDGSGSGLDADLLDGLHASSFARTSGTYSGLRAQATTKADVGLSNVPNWSSGTFDGRYLGKTANAVSASKWTTAKTLSLTGDVTGSVSWDGSANASIAVTLNDDALNDQYVQIGSRHTGDASNITATSYRLWDVSTSSDKPSGSADGLLLTGYWDSSSWATQQYHDFHTNDLYLRSKQSGTWMPTWDRVFHDTYHPNADKWTTARTITLGGDLTGSVSLDGSSNVTLSAQVANDSHTHDGRYVNVTGDTMSGTLGFSNNGSHLRYGSSDNYMFSLYNSSYAGAVWRSAYNTTIQADHDGTGSTEYFRIQAGGGTPNELKLLSKTSGQGQNANALLLNGHKVWNAANHGSGSGLDADLLDGLDSVKFARSGFVNDAYVDFTIDGDANTYYPVSFYGGGAFGFQRYSISRGYSWTAPSSWHTASHKGGLTFTMEWCGDSAWGGNNKDIRVVQFHEQYTTMVGGLDLSVGGGGLRHLVVWLRGGGARYRLHHPLGKDASVSISYSNTTASNGKVYSPRSYNGGTVVGEVYSRYPVRGSGGLFVSNNPVFHDGYHPNADKWTTARTISLAGDASGSVSIDGSSNRTLTVSVANDSHTHDGRYYTEAESDSRYVNVTGDTMTGDLQMGSNRLSFSTSNPDIGLSNNGNRICVGRSVAQGFNAGSILVSNAWADASKVPTNGMYVKGQVHADGGLIQDGHVVLNGSDTWIRTKSRDGIYFSSYGGGIHMTDSTWVRVYNGKSFLSTGTIQGGKLKTKSSADEAQVELYASNNRYSRMFYRGSDANFGLYMTDAKGKTETRVRWAGNSRSWEFYDLVKAKATNGTVSRVLTYDDFLPATPPAGLENTITANWIGAGAINARHLQVNSLVNDGGTYTSFKVAPDATRPLALSRTDSSGNEVAPIFYVDTKGNGFFDGKLSKDTVDIDSIQEEARKQINPYYIGTVSGSTQTSTNVAMSSGGTHVLATVNVLGGKVNLSWEFSGTKQYFAQGGNQGYTAPTWRVEVFRGSSTSSTRIVNRTYTGSAYNNVEREIGFWDGQASIYINDQFSDITSASSQQYTIRVTLVSGTSTPIKLNRFVGSSPAFKRIEMKYDYTSLYYNASGLGAGNITLSDDYDKYEFLAVAGAEDNDDVMGITLIPTYAIATETSKFDNNQFMLSSPGYGRYWRVQLSGKRTLYGRGENSLIRRIWGVNIVEKV